VQSSTCHTEIQLAETGVASGIDRPVPRRAAAVKAMVEQAQPFDEAPLGDLVLGHQTLTATSRHFAVAVQKKDVEDLACRLIAGH
jgi:hypothetical protein